MIINGFLKMTLLDFPNHVACTVFTAGCNMRCPFCHNASLVTKINSDERISEKYIMNYLEKRKGLLDGVAITGGEPLMHTDIADFIKDIRSLGYKIKLDTNGTFPERLSALIDKGMLDYVAMDIKNCPEKYAETTGVPSFDFTPVNESVKILTEGKTDYEFRTTVVRQFHDISSIERAASFIAGAKQYFLQSFTDSGNLIGKNMCAVTKDEMLKMAQAAQKYVLKTFVRGI